MPEALRALMATGHLFYWQGITIKVGLKRTTNTRLLKENYNEEEC